jgi:hypothetical protein
MAAFSPTESTGIMFDYEQAQLVLRGFLEPVFFLLENP